jgi:PIN domain nuclease of toxin-antitoxin system
MNVLLDTHVLIWWLNEPEKVSRRAKSTISNQDNVVYVSAASAWEIAIKANLGKLIATSFVFEFQPLHHRDPFDRLLVAQAQSSNTPIVSADPVLDRYDIKRIW